MTPEQPSHLTTPKTPNPIPSDPPPPQPPFPNAALVHRIDAFLAEKSTSPIRTATQSKVHESLSVIQQALTTYGLDSLSLSFNGGKDCLVLLLLYIYILSRTPHPAHRIPTCFVTPPHSFPEVDEFVTDCADTYGLDVVRIALPMKAAFEVYLRKREGTRAVLVGTRRTDPHGERLTYFDVTDHGWPKFMRVHPVIDWHYWEIWDVVPPFLRALQVPYCVLYDRGFTSLGGTLDTHPNPLLKDGQGDGRFKPAYELEDETKERYGRDR